MRNIRNMDIEWGYEGDCGPEHWHTLCDWFSEGAKYPYQSPINLSQQNVNGNATKKEIIFHYKTEEFTEKEFKNTFHFIPPNTESYVVFEEEKFYLTDIHFHTPSEHTFDDEHFPVEFHLVHMNNTGENLVVGCLFTFTTNRNKFSEQEGAFIWNEKTHQQWFDPSVFLPEKRSHFHYLGSLTTPPTKGPVHWFVFDTIQQMDSEFYTRIHEGMLTFNNRPTQKLSGRKLYYSE